ncbi:hypothetical protein FRC00_005687 [Tulasnella sp. 408]|nr:hypothetical protein FRC00_005687 [Tulasnella sp. 408]
MPIFAPQVVHDVQIVNDVHPAKDDAATTAASVNATCLFCHNSPAASQTLCRSCAKQHADAAVAIVDEEDDHHYARRDALSHTADEPYLQSTLRHHPTDVKRPMPIPTSTTTAATRMYSSFAIISPPSSSSTKLRSFSDVSDASSRPSLGSSSPTDSSFSSYPPSPFYLEEEPRGRSPSFSRDSSVDPSSPSSCIASTSSFPAPDPYRDITHIRSSPRGNNALYPGATFAGTQKSGRNNYEVTVTVLDVDFVTSQLSGYLKIKGLTDDWPELTTYFDAEIIGERYGFLTTQPDLGATETEDMTHWGRFPAFRSLKNEMRRPNLTISDRHREKKGVVFMRWKERFLVPDWKVRDINGASFAGFYYVCVEFNPGRGSSPTAPSFADDDDFPTLGSPVSPVKSRSSGPATMTGFYYHADSEPYQQLSLAHVPEERQQVAFEFR